MSKGNTTEESDLSDAELVQVLKNHGIERRSLMKVVGAGAGIAALSGTAAGQKGRGNRIDKVYGAPYAADEHTVPSGLVDHTIELHVHPGPGDHEGFPLDEDGEEIPVETFFDPVGLHVNPGEIVEFTVHGDGLHTVTAFDPKFNEPPFIEFPDRVPTDHAFTSPPVAEDDSWLYKFTTKGVYDIHCLPHISLGMVVRILVFDPEDDDLSDETFDEPTGGPLLPNAEAVLTDDALDPANIESEGEVAWADLNL
jgi:plastocyanin